MESDWLNPSSPYRAAAAVRVRWDALRERLAARLGMSSERLIFNSGATEGNNAVLRHLRATLPPDARIAVSPIEHPSVLEPAKALFAERIEWLPVDGAGRVAMENLAISGLSAVVLMAANNETGMCQPWHDLALVCRSAGVPFHCDASQWIGKLPLTGLAECAFVTGCAHKFGGPRGVGFLAVPAGTILADALRGGAQQAGQRAGTEDLPGVAAMVAALGAVDGCEAGCGGAGKHALWSRLQRELPGVALVGALEGSLWNTVMLSLPDFSSPRWIRALEKRGFLLSAGSACSTGHEGRSPVLAAMGIDGGVAARVLRISSGWTTTLADWQALSDAILDAYGELRAGVGTSPARVITF